MTDCKASQHRTLLSASSQPFELRISNMSNFSEVFPVISGDFGVIISYVSALQHVKPNILHLSHLPRTLTATEYHLTVRGSFFFFL